MSIKLCKFEGNSFNVLNLDTETNTSLIRSINQIRISYNDNKLVQFIKDETATTQIGTLLIANGNVLIPTGDSLSSKSVAKLLSLPDAESQTKTVDGQVLYLLPVQIL